MRASGTAQGAPQDPTLAWSAGPGNGHRALHCESSGDQVPLPSILTRMRRSTRYSLLGTLLIVLLLSIAIVLRKEAPPEVARLLPESDAIVYANVKPLRLATNFDRTPVAHSAEYQRFIAATGILPERDLDAVAFALHRMSDPNGPNGPVGYSEVFEGHFDGARLTQYLQSIASGREMYAGHEIFTIPVEEAPGRPRRELRVTQLGYDTIAASNMPSTEQIHSMLDRHRAAALPFAAPRCWARDTGTSRCSQASGPSAT